ncbi:hypothetical protein B7P43_G01280 [Cryptotermes secundus]|uniref:Uncharacterized protein n=1 Tax=Cryptotermes secundus TaxID=105785 RepID=A0A2J7RP56_9NEOP|nr:hypothetical protein B7P43_G01280 [Cryptotermes secundus]
MPPTTVHRVLHKRLCLHPYKVQIVQQLLPDDKPRREPPSHIGVWMFRGLSMPPSKIADWMQWTNSVGPRSPDLTLLDFSLWGYVKNRVFVNPVNDLPDSQARIRETTATVPMDMLERTWQEIE